MPQGTPAWFALAAMIVVGVVAYAVPRRAGVGRVRFFADHA